METIYMVIAIIIFVFFFCSQDEQYTNFCGNCHDLPLNKCGDCVNCGIRKLDDGTEICSQGNEAGPYFYDDTSDWKYNKKFSND